MSEREGETDKSEDGKRRRSHGREGDPIRAGDPTRDQTRENRFNERGGEGNKVREKDYR